MNDSIKDLIDEMEKNIYKNPYPILFGRIPINRPKNKPIIDINDNFYDGFNNL